MDDAFWALPTWTHPPSKALAPTTFPGAGWGEGFFNFLGHRWGKFGRLLGQNMARVFSFECLLRRFVARGISVILFVYSGVINFRKRRNKGNLAPVFLPRTHTKTNPSFATKVLGGFAKNLNKLFDKRDC